MFRSKVISRTLQFLLMILFSMNAKLVHSQEPSSIEIREGLTATLMQYGPHNVTQGANDSYTVRASFLMNGSRPDEEEITNIATDLCKNFGDDIIDQSKTLRPADYEALLIGMVWVTLDLYIFRTKATYRTAFTLEGCEVKPNYETPFGF